MEIFDFFKSVIEKTQLDYMHPIGQCVMFDTAAFDPNEMWGGYGNSHL